MKRILTLSATLISLLSCTVREDRMPCPCWLDIDLSLCARYSDEVSLRGWNSSRPLFGDILSPNDWPEGWETTVPKGTVDYTAYMGLDNCALTGNTLVTPRGKEFDEIWAYHTSLIAENEEELDRVVPHKQYCQVTVKMREIPEGWTSARIRGNSAGFSLLDLEPVDGEYDVTLGIVRGNTFIFNLPRQNDSWLTMELLCEGTPVRKIELGEMIAGAGFDWSAEDLDDIYVSLDLTRTEADIRIESWKKGSTYEYSDSGSNTAVVNIDVCENGYVPTRSAFDWGESEIKDIQVIITDNCGRVVESIYSHSASGLSFEGIKGQDYSLWTFANLGGEIVVADIEDVLTAREVSRRDIERYGIPMFPDGCTDIHVTGNGDCATITLTRMLARVDFSIDRSRLASPEGFSINSLSIFNPTDSYLPFDGEVRKESQGTAEGVFDYATVEDLSCLMNGQTVPFYAFENMQGTLLPGNTDPWKKVPSFISSTADKCTWIEAKCSYSSGGRSSNDITYRMYLGADATTNFDVRRNTVYRLTLIPTEEEIYGERGSWKIESGPWNDRRPVSLEFVEQSKEIWIDGPNSRGRGSWTPLMIVTYADGTTSIVSGPLTSSDPGIASASGITVRGVSVGTAYVTGSYTEYGITVSTESSARVDVTDPLIDLILEPSELVITKAESFKDWTATAIYPSHEETLVWDAAEYSAGKQKWSLYSTNHIEMFDKIELTRPDFTLSTRSGSFLFGYDYAISVKCSELASDDAEGTLSLNYTDGGVTLNASCRISATNATPERYELYLSDTQISLEQGTATTVVSYLLTYWSNGRRSSARVVSDWTFQQNYQVLRLGGSYATSTVLPASYSADKILVWAAGTGTSVATATVTDPNGVTHSESCIFNVGHTPAITYEEEYELQTSPGSAVLEENCSVRLKAWLITSRYTLSDGIRTGEVTRDAAEVTDDAQWSLAAGSEYVRNDGRGTFTWISGPGVATVVADYRGETSVSHITTSDTTTDEEPDPEPEITRRRHIAITNGGVLAAGASATFIVRLYTDVYEDSVLVDEDLSGEIISNGLLDWGFGDSPEGMSGSDPHATITQEGVITGVSEGSCTVVASLKDDATVYDTRGIEVVTSTTGLNLDIIWGSGNYHINIEF